MIHTAHILHFTLHNPHFPLQHPLIPTPHFTIHIVTIENHHSILYSLRFTGTLRTLHSALCTPDCTLHTFYTAHFTFYIVYSTPHTLQSILSCPQSPLRTFYCTFHTPLHALHFTTHTPHTLLYTADFLHFRFHIPHFNTSHSIHFFFYTVQSPLPTPHPLYTLHSTLHTLLHTAHFKI